MDGGPPRTPPIEPQEFLSGVNVVDIGDIRVSRGLSRRPFSGCYHRRVAYDVSERRIWCRDCETDVEPFDAFKMVVDQFHYASEALNQRKQKIEEAERFSIRSIAAKVIDQEWRRRSTVPACPHCGHGLFPEHFVNGASTVGREYAAARLRKEKGK